MNNLKDVIKSLTIRCNRLFVEIKNLKQKLSNVNDTNQALRKGIEKMGQELEYYRSRSQELTYIEKAITPEKAQDIAMHGRTKEEQEKQRRLFTKKKTNQIAI